MGNTSSTPRNMRIVSKFTNLAPGGTPKPVQQRPFWPISGWTPADRYVTVFSVVSKRGPPTSLFFFALSIVRVLLRRRIKDASPQLRLTVFQLLEPEVESWERMDSRVAL